VNDAPLPSVRYEAIRAHLLFGQRGGRAAGTPQTR